MEKFGKIIDLIGDKLENIEFVGTRKFLHIKCRKCTKNYQIYIPYNDKLASQLMCPCQKPKTRNEIKFAYVLPNVEIEGYRLLSNFKHYINDKSKIILLCPHGHEFKITYYKFVHLGWRCIFCIKSMNLSKITESYPEFNKDILDMHFICQKLRALKRIEI
jgi:predicted nucleic-acid-binding Zn-ribbon protein